MTTAYAHSRWKTEYATVMRRMFDACIAAERRAIARAEAAERKAVHIAFAAILSVSVAVFYAVCICEECE